MKDQNYIRFDWAIKRLLRDKANFGVLEGFLTTLLGENIKISNLLESEANQESKDDKGEYIIIEVQITGDFDYFRRMLYAVSKTITEHMKLGMSYKEVKKVYSVNIIYFSLGMKDDYVYHGTTEFKGLHTQTVIEMNEEERISFGLDEVYEVFPEYYLLCVNNFDDIALTPLDEWIEYLKTTTIPDSASAPGLAEAHKLLALDTMSEQERRIYERHLDSHAVEYDTICNALRRGRYEGKAEGLAEGLIQGKAEGFAEGEAREQRLIAGNLKGSGFAPEVIVRSTGLSIEEIDLL